MCKSSHTEQSHLLFVMCTNYVSKHFSIHQITLVTCWWNICLCPAAWLMLLCPTTGERNAAFELSLTILSPDRIPSLTRDLVLHILHDCTPHTTSKRWNTQAEGFKEDRPGQGRKSTWWSPVVNMGSEEQDLLEPRGYLVCKPWPCVCSLSPSTHTHTQGCVYGVRSVTCVPLCLCWDKRSWASLSFCWCWERLTANTIRFVLRVCVHSGGVFLSINLL